MRNPPAGQFLFAIVLVIGTIGPASSTLSERMNGTVLAAAQVNKLNPLSDSSSKKPSPATKLSSTTHSEPKDRQVRVMDLLVNKGCLG